MNQIPEKLSDFRIYRDNNLPLGVADLQLPSFDHMTETISGAGIAGEYESVNIGHFSAQKLTVNWRVLNDDFVQFMEPNSVLYDCRGANQVLDAATGQYTMVPVRVQVRGLATKADPGKMAKGSPYEASTEIEVVYIKITINNVTKVELDKLNYKYVVNGKDYLADVRQAMGL